MAQWLTIVSWVAVTLGLLTALAIAFDVAAHPQHMKIMNVVWPITGLYLPIAGWLFYADMARRRSTRDMDRRETSSSLQSPQKQKLAACGKC